jgi:hypothetical protein
MADDLSYAVGVTDDVMPSDVRDELLVPVRGPVHNQKPFVAQVA